MTIPPRVTLVIPTLGRPEFLARALGYYAAVAPSWPILVADSSRQDAARANARTASRSPSVRYRAFANDVPVGMKIARALDEVETSYAVLAADDDFLVPRSLDAGSRWLDEHADYALVHGQAGYVVLESGAAVHGRPVGLGRYGQRGLEQASASARLLDHMGSYRTTFYSLQRTDALRRQWALTASIHADYQFVELLPSCLSVIQGKARCQKGLHMVRQGHAQQTSVTNQRRLIDWIGDADWSRQFQAARQLLVEALVETEGLPLHDARRVVTQAFKRYVAAKAGQPDRSEVLERVRRWGRSQSALRSAWTIAKRLMPTLPGTFSLEAWRRPYSAWYAEFRPIDRSIREAIEPVTATPTASADRPSAWAAPKAA